MNTTYHIHPTVRVLNDSPKNIDFHIRSGDYFSFLATMMGFLEDALGRAGSGVTEQERALASELRHDLRYVQANYTIVPRALEDIRIVHPKGNLLAKQKAQRPQAQAEVLAPASSVGEKTRPKAL